MAHANPFDLIASRLMKDVGQDAEGIYWLTGHGSGSGALTDLDTDYCAHWLKARWGGSVGNEARQTQDGRLLVSERLRSRVHPLILRARSEFAQVNEALAGMRAIEAGLIDGATAGFLQELTRLESSSREGAEDPLLRLLKEAENEPSPSAFKETSLAVALLEFQKAKERLAAIHEQLARTAPALASRVRALDALILPGGVSLPFCSGERPPTQREREALTQWGDFARRLATFERRHFEAGLSLTIEHLFRDPAVVVSGGVSLGSYQGGFLDFYSRYMKTTRQELLKGLLALVPPEVPPARLPRVPTRFDIATGASAGSINALLAGLVGCRDNTLDPMPDARDPGKELNVEDSIFYQVWHPVGFGKLFKPGEVGSSNLFDDSSTGPVNARIEHVREILQKTTTGWRDCQFDLGITVTRLGKRDIDLMNYAAQKAPNVQSLIPRATEKLMFTWAYGGNPAELTATGFEFADDWRYDVYPRLLPSGVTTAGAKLSPKDVLDAVKASSTFPVAFKPTSLTMTHYADGMWSPPEQADYFDGGAFNNNPLDIALTLHRERQGPGGPNARSYLYLDPDIVDWQFTDTVLKKKPDAGLLTTFSPFLGSAFSVASNSQLMSALETSPELRGRIELPARRGATASDYLVAMVGFFEPEFRRFDFYRGMVDATRFIDGSAESIVANLLGRSLVEPVVAALGSPTLDCMIGFEREQTMVAPACAGPVDDNMRALMRVTRQMRLYERNARVVREQVFTMQTPMVQPAGATCYQLPRCDQCRAMSVRPSDGLSGCEPSRWFGVSEAECNKCVARAPGLLCAPALSEADWFELFMEQLKNDGKGEGTKKCGETPAFRFTKVDLDTTPEGFRSEMRSKVGKAVSKLVAKQESPFERTALHTAAEIGLDLGLERQARSFWTVGGSGGGSGLSVDVGYSLMGGQNARFGGQLVGRFVPFASHQIPPTDSGLGFVNRTELALVPRAVFSVGPWPGEALFWDFTVGASLRAGWFEFLGNHIGGAKGFQPGPDLVLLSPEVTVGASIIDRVGLHVRWTIDPWAWELHGKRVPSALHSGSTLPQIPLGNINLGFEWRIW